MSYVTKFGSTLEFLMWDCFMGNTKTPLRHIRERCRRVFYEVFFARLRVRERSRNPTLYDPNVELMIYDFVAPQAWIGDHPNQILFRNYGDDYVRRAPEGYHYGPSEPRHKKTRLPASMFSRSQGYCYTMESLTTKGVKTEYCKLTRLIAAEMHYKHFIKENFV